jgi:hypothetical protein
VAVSLAKLLIKCKTKLPDRTMAVIKQSNQSSPRGTCRFSIWILLATNLMVFLVTWNLGEVGDEQTLPQTVDTHKTASSAGSVGGGYSLVPNTGKAMALPSIRVRKDTSLPETIYGGKGDKPHLGGFTDMDHHGVSPKAWSWMVKNVGVKSVIDVGCGRGISTSWFYFHGLDVLCAEGSHDAIENTMLPDPSLIVEHDFSQGPWWPEKTYDAVWCVEFLEHVSTLSVEGFNWLGSNSLLQNKFRRHTQSASSTGRSGKP